MTKTFLSALCLSMFTFSVWACKPFPTRECTSPDIKIDIKGYQQLFASINTYQKMLDQNVQAGPGQTSCFNNHFAAYYGKILMDELKTFKGKACSETRDRVRTVFHDLLRIDSPEFQSLTPEVKRAMKVRAIDLNYKVQDFFLK